MFVWLKRSLGFKDRILFPCPGGVHDWRETFGDERLHTKRYQCRNCPAARNVL